jgi:fructose-specific phosphotransferase system IIA component
MSAVSENLVFLDVLASSKEEALKMIADFAFNEGVVKDSNSYFEALKAREFQSSTGFSDGIAIPHGKSSAVNHAAVIFVRFKEGIDWDSMDGKPTNIAIGLAIPEDGNNNHLKVLSSIARSLMKEEFKSALNNSETKAQVIEALNSAIN